MIGSVMMGRREMGRPGPGRVMLFGMPWLGKLHWLEGRCKDSPFADNDRTGGRPEGGQPLLRHLNLRLPLPLGITAVVPSI